MRVRSKTSIALLGRRILCFIAITFVSQSYTHAVAADVEQAGTPGVVAEPQTQAALTGIPCPNSNGLDVAVLAYCTDLAGIFGAQNTATCLVNDGRFGSVTLIDGDVVQPTADELLECFDCVITMTDNRCGGNTAPLIQAGDALAGFANGGGGVVLCTFGFATGIGFGDAVFAAGLSPFQKVQGGNGPFLNTLDPSTGASDDPACECLFDGLLPPFSSRFSNVVTLSPGAILCATFTNGLSAAAINPGGNVIALNTFTAYAVNTNQPDYCRFIANAVSCVCEVCEPVEDPSVRTQGFWKQVCRKPHPSGEHENLPGYVDCVNRTLTFADVDDVDDLCDRLNPNPKNDKCEQAEAQFVALLLNVCSGRVATCNCVLDPNLGETTVGEVIDLIDGLLSNAGRTFDDCVLAQSLADSINNSLTLVPCP